MLKIEGEIRRVYLEIEILQEGIEKKQKEAAIAKEKKLAAESIMEGFLVVARSRRLYVAVTLARIRS